LPTSHGRPYTAVFDNNSSELFLVPGEGSILSGSGVRDVDFSVARDVKLNERVRLRLEAETFDLFTTRLSAVVVDNLQYFVAGGPMRAEIPFYLDVDTSQGNNGHNDHFGKLERSRRNMALEFSNSPHGLVFRTFKSTQNNPMIGRSSAFVPCLDSIQFHERFRLKGVRHSVANHNC